MIDYSPEQHEVKSAEALQALIDEIGQEVLNTLLGVFTAETTTLFDSLPVALEQGDANEATRLLHSIKSGAKTYGALRLAALAAELESAARQGDLGSVKSHMASLESVLQETLAEYGPA